MADIKQGHRFHPGHPMIDDRDVVLAEHYEALQERLKCMASTADDLLDQLINATEVDDPVSDEEIQEYRAEISKCKELANG